jgi:hypothetical protein
VAERYHRLTRHRGLAGDVTEGATLAYSSIEAGCTAAKTEHKGSADRGFAPQFMEEQMMESVLDCGTNGWLMIAGGVLTYGVLIMAGAALIKYLCVAERNHAASS